MEKKLYYRLRSNDGEGGIMQLFGAMAWIEGDVKEQPDADDVFYTLH